MLDQMQQEATHTIGARPVLAPAQAWQWMRSTLPPYVTIGPYTYFVDLVVRRWGQEKVTIGKYCSIALQVQILAGGNHRTDTVSTYPFDTLVSKSVLPDGMDRSYDGRAGDVEIGSDVWVGYGAVIHSGVTVGNGAVVAAGAHVFTDVPPYAVAVGNPAKVTRYRFNDSIIESLLEIAWWDWPDETVKVRVDDFYLPVSQFIRLYQKGAYA